MGRMNEMVGERNKFEKESGNNKWCRDFLNKSYGNVLVKLVCK